jgi:predicted RNase H-like HicB family nuclease
MSTTAKRSKRRSRKLDRPFATEILARARRIAETYQVVMWFEDGDYFGRGVELPGKFADGKTPDQCMRNTREAFVATIATMLEDGQAPPPAANEGARTEQVNVRLTAEEKVSLEAAARREGYRDVCDFVRSAALAKA